MVRNHGKALECVDRYVTSRAVLWMLTEAIKSRVFTFGEVFPELHYGGHVTVDSGVGVGDCGLGFCQPLSNHAADVRSWDLCESALEEAECDRGKQSVCSYNDLV